MKKSLPLLAAAATVAIASSMSAAPAFAQAVFTGAGTGTTCDPQKTGVSSSTSANAFGTVVCTSGAVTTTLQAWGWMGATTVSSLGTTTSTAGFVQGNLGDFNSAGIGAYTGNKEASANYGEHAFDNVATSCSTSTDAVNYSGSTTVGGGSAAVTVSTANGGCGGAIEAMLLSFNSKVSLSQIKSGYQGADADFNLYVWTGTGGPNMSTQSLSNNAATGLAGWTLVSSGDFGGTGVDGVGATNSNPFDITQTASSLYSSYFLVTTYFGAGGTGLDYGNDQFKISGWTANTCTGTLTGTGSAQTCSTTPPKAPEPGSLALVGAALLAVTASRRRLFGRR